MSDKSKCCDSAVRIGGSGEGTSWYECTRCGRPCDLVGEKSELEKWIEDSSRDSNVSELEELFKRQGAFWLLEKAEEWCGINAYDADKGACDEHTVDECRGRQCSAEELFDHLKELCGK